MEIRLVATAEMEREHSERARGKERRKRNNFSIPTRRGWLIFLAKHRLHVSRGSDGVDLFLSVRLTGMHQK